MNLVLTAKEDGFGLLQGVEVVHGLADDFRAAAAFKEERTLSVLDNLAAHIVKGALGTSVLGDDFDQGVGFVVGSHFLRRGLHQPGLSHDKRKSERLLEALIFSIIK